MAKVVVAHSGKQHAYQLALALHKLGSLQRFYTSSYISSAQLQDWFLQRGNTYFTRRFVSGLASPQVVANWRFELPEILLRAALGKSPKVQRAVYARDVRFDAYMARKLKHEQAEIFWGFQGSCHQSLQAARQQGKLAVCELATAHVTEAQRILGEEASLLPDWADSIDNLVFPSDYETRLQEEPHRAQAVIAASEFTRQSLIHSGVASEKILQLPLGFDLDHIPYSTQSPDFGKRPLRLLYAGTVTQRKGMAYLLEAMQQLHKHDVALHVIGGVQGSGRAFWAQKKLFTYHPPLAQQQLFERYAHYDALVLPTLFEGFGLVIVEALAAGLPVITTPHSMGPDVINHQHNGYLVPVRNPQAIVQAVEHLATRTPEQYNAMRAAARRSVLGFSWQSYTQLLRQLLPELNQLAATQT